MERLYRVVVTALDIVDVKAESAEKAEELARIAYMCNPRALPVTFDAEEVTCSI